jgi:hypothetical protein
VPRAWCRIGHSALTPTKRVLIVSQTTGYQLRAFGDAASRLGVELAFATDRCHMLDDPWRDAAVPVRFYDEDGSLEAIAEAARTAPYDGILAVGDRPTILAALAAERFGLPGNPPDGARASANKRLSRERIAAAGLPAPWFFSIPASAGPRAAAADARYPCVVKPLAMAGSRGVMRANDARELERAIERLQGLLARPQIRAQRNPAHESILIEGYLPGRELALEGVLEQGSLRTLAIFDKPDPLEGPFFEETIYVTPAALAADAAASIVHTVAAAARAIGLRHGPVHAECRVNDRGAYVLEVAARPIGGLCARSLRFCTRGAQRPQRRSNAETNAETAESAEISLEELLLRHAVGEPVAGYMREARASAVMMIPIPRRGLCKGVDGLEKARMVEGVDEIAITAKPDQLLLPLPEGASYLGFIFARAARGDEAVAAVRAAHARLEFKIDKAVEIAPAPPT